MANFHIKTRELVNHTFTSDFQRANYWEAKAKEWEDRYDSAQSDAYEEVTVLKNTIEKMKELIVRAALNV